jgi:hypothetical protein
MRCCNFLTPRRAMRPTPSHSFPHTTAAETCRAACLRSRARARFLKARGVIRSAFWAWAVPCLHKEPGAVRSSGAVMWLARRSRNWVYFFRSQQASGSGERTLGGSKRYRMSVVVV